MNLTLERFSTIRLHEQAPDMTGLVRANRAQLEELDTGTLTRHRNIFNSIRNLARIAWNEDMEGYMAYDDNGVPRAVGTIIVHKTVEHPTAGKFMGNELDYWMDVDGDDEAHAQMAGRLLDESDKLELRKYGQKIEPTLDGGLYGRKEALHHVMATTPIGHLQHNRGLHGILQPTGTPEVLAIPPDERQFGLDRGGQTVQLYTGSFLVSRAIGEPIVRHPVREVDG